MLRNRKANAGLRWLLILSFFSAVGSGMARASDDVPTGYKADRYQQVWERNPFTLVAPVAQTAQPKIFDKLVLVSWLNDGRKDIVFVQNTETNEVQKITSDANGSSFRLVAIHKAPDPKDAEVVLSNGTEQGSVKFRLETVMPAPQPPPGQQPAMPTTGVQSPPSGAPGQGVPGMPVPVQMPQNGQPTVQQPTVQQPVRTGATPIQAERGLPPRASEVRRKRITPPPVTEQPVAVPTPAQNLPAQPQTQ